MSYTAERHHDISVGHRVHGHESKCAHFHGHNYRMTFVCGAANLDSVGRVIDFSVIKEKLCMWLEDNWDHKFLMWQQDPAYLVMYVLDPDGVVGVEFNPTAENMAAYMVNVVGPAQLHDTGVTLLRCIVQETYKCSATYYAQESL